MNLVPSGFVCRWILRVSVEIQSLDKVSVVMTPGLRLLEIGNSPGLLPYCVGGLAEITWAHSVTTVAAWLANS